MERLPSRCCKPLYEFCVVFMASNDVERTLDEDVVPLLLLVLLMLLVYLAIFISLKNLARGRCGKKTIKSSPAELAPAPSADGRDRASDEHRAA